MAPQLVCVECGTEQPATSQTTQSSTVTCDECDYSAPGYLFDPHEILPA